jgi:hypothetical protein
MTNSIAGQTIRNAYWIVIETLAALKFGIILAFFLGVSTPFAPRFDQKSTRVTAAGHVTSRIHLTNIFTASIQN